MPRELSASLTHSLFESWCADADSVVLICDVETGEIVDVIGPCAEWFNCSVEDIPFRIAQLMSKTDIAGDHLSIVAALLNEVERNPTSREWRIRGKSGHARVLRSKLAVFEEGKDRKLTVFVTDVTEKKNLLDRLRKSGEFENIGRLADAMAHDFNNCMQAIMGHAHIICMDRMGGNEQEDSLEEIKRAAEKAGQLAQQLLVFRRLRKLDESVFDLNALVHEILPVARQIMGDCVEIDNETATHPCLIKADYRHIENLLMNLVFNARESITEAKGRITVRTAVISLDEKWRKDYPWTVPGEYVSLVVKDTGVGMTEEVRRNALEPFFTTGEPAPGKGLGLCTVDAIVKHHSGVFKMTSRPGFGTTATVLLRKAQN